MSNVRRPVILVVDDDERNLRLIEAMLARLDCETVLAYDGGEALERMARQPPDLVLVDLMMPGIDGLEVTRRIRADAHTRMLPVVMITAMGDVQSRINALDAGVDDFLAKPVDMSELTARVRSLLKVKEYQDRLRDHQLALEAEVCERTQQLQDALARLESSARDTINRLAAAAEYKDEDTGMHIVRMSRYAAIIARRLGLPDEFAEAIGYAAPMHDVGKIGIPDRILLKPGPLDAEEWVLMKTHPEIGARILRGAASPFIKLGESIALTHHEKWDGSGYPRGLRQAEIPIEGRIAAVADVFDALTSVRPYKRAFSFEESLHMVREGRGRHFDPDVLDAFLSDPGEILAVRLQYQDRCASPLVQMNEFASGPESARLEA